MHPVINAFKRRIDRLNDKIAQGIESDDRRLFTRSIVIILSIVVLSALIALCIIIGVWNFFHSFWGQQLLKVILGILFLCLLYFSYRANQEEKIRKTAEKISKNHLEVWAEDVYEYVRDAIFLVLRSVSEHTEIVMPSSPGMVELPNRISIKDGYAVFNFFAKVRNPVDPKRTKSELTRTLNQMIRAHELSGIPCDLVQIDGSYYCSLLILNVLDFGEYINIAVVFADEKTVKIARAFKQVYLQGIGEKRTNSSNSPYDDQL